MVALSGLSCHNRRFCMHHRQGSRLETSGCRFFYRLLLIMEGELNAPMYSTVVRISCANIKAKQ